MFKAGIHPRPYLNFAVWMTISCLLATFCGGHAFAQERPAPQGLLQVDPSAVGLDPRPLARIRGEMEKFVSAGEITGAVTLVAYRGGIVHWEAVGMADIEAERRMERDSLFAIASMTKPITAAALMVLAERGQVKLDEPAENYLPELAALKLNGKRPEKPVTVRHLLTHTSGLGGDQQMHGSLAETVQWLAQQPLQFEPGTQWRYGAGLTVCGRIVEVVSGQSFESFLEREIFSPLGMHDTTFHPNDQQKMRIAKLYQRRASEDRLAPAEHWLIDLRPDAPPNPSGGLFSTATDLVRFYQAILGKGSLTGQRILKPESVREMLRAQTGELTTGFTPGNTWGLGWCLIRNPQGVTGVLAPGSFGHGGAFGTQGWVDPVKRMIFILLIQRLNLPNADQSEMRRVFQECAVQAICSG